MARGARLLLHAAVCGVIVGAVFAPTIAGGERGFSRGAQVVPQRVVLPAAEPAAPAQPTQRVADVKPEPVRAELAGAEVTTRDCADRAGAETKLAMLENSAVWGHCAKTR